MAARREEGSRVARRAPASLSVGFLAMLPLFAAYEWSISRGGAPVRNSSEMLLSLPLAPLGELAPIARGALLLAAGALAAALVRARRWELGAAVLRVPLEGLLAGVALGPALLIATSLLGDVRQSVGLGAAPSQHLADLALTALCFGGAAYEELVFRVGLYGLLFLAVRRGAAALGLPPLPARASAEALGLVLSSALFAAFHLARLTSFLGAGGEPFHAGLFAWRFFAGLLLGALFRWRGPGVAGWAHGLFNASLILGAGPGVLV